MKIRLQVLIPDWAIDETSGLKLVLSLKNTYKNVKMLSTNSQFDI